MPSAAYRSVACNGGLVGWGDDDDDDDDDDGVVVCLHPFIAVRFLESLHRFGKSWNIKAKEFRNWKIVGKLLFRSKKVFVQKCKIWG